MNVGLRADSITVVSQNTLHYGWGTTNPSRICDPNCIAKLASLVANIGLGDVTVMQEIMPQAQTALLTAGGCTTCGYEESPSYGNGFYRERYLFVIADPKKVTTVGSVIECSTTGANCTFSRPPAALKVKKANSTKTIVIVDFHAVWGRSQSLRIAEAKLMPGLVDKLSGAGNLPVVVGGDWNLTADEIKSAASCPATCAAPDGLTTLNPNGKPSSSYDHFYKKNVTGTSKTPAVIPANVGDQKWRAVVSDHLGVIAGYNY
jgi:endonuclease/exonuclease/phosphatase family metal-dependent hydrolase